MRFNHAGIIRGLSIANIVIGALLLCILLYGFFFFDIGAAILATNSSPEGLSAGKAIYGNLLLMAFFFVIIPFIAGILGTAFARRPQKLTIVLVFNILGAIAYVVGFGLIGVVFAALCVLVAIFSFQDKKAYDNKVYLSKPVPGEPLYTTPTAAQNIPVVPGTIAGSQSLSVDEGIPLGIPVTPPDPQSPPNPQDPQG